MDPGAEHWPTLGPQVCAFIQQNLVFGPGDLRGTQARLDDEKRALVYWMYEVYPRHRPKAGRRRFNRVAISLRKGTAKTELAAWLAAVELHHAGPVRTVGWEKDGSPIGGPVTDPYIPLIAYTEEQSEELAYGALLAILGESPIAGDFDLGLSRILRRDGTGRAVALSGAPGPRDGARTTFQVFDESHRMVLPRQKAAHRTMLANVPKRKLADAWTLETTTAYSPGEGSVAETTMDYARKIESGQIKDSRLFFFHRQASDQHDLETEEGVRAAVMEASGPAAEWSNIDGIIGQWQDPTADRAFLERVWTNRPVQGSELAFDVEAFGALAASRFVDAGELITLGFDGSRFDDATALVGTHVESGYQWVVGLWERPYGVAEWEVPDEEVDGAVSDAFGRWKVCLMYADPPKWESWVSAWAGRYGHKVVLAWWTNRRRQMAYALKAYEGALAAGELSHDGDARFVAHIGNSRRLVTKLMDEQENPLWILRKERPDSPHKIDLAMAGVLSWEARRDAVAAGVLNVPKRQWLL